MERLLPENPIIRELAGRYRVVLLGGMAIIAHGLARSTKDIDIWLEPFDSPDNWAEKFLSVCDSFPEAKLWSLGRRCTVGHDEVSEEIEQFGVLRVEGFNLPVDVFRKPNELVLEDFERVWSGVKLLRDGVGLPAEVDLYLTKENTGRPHDFDDQTFLKSKVTEQFRTTLPTAEPAEAIGMMEKYADPEVLAFALENPHPEVRDYALKVLREFEADGDPYSRDILAAWHASVR